MKTVVQTPLPVLPRARLPRVPHEGNGAGQEHEVVSWLAMLLASVTGLAPSPPPVRLEVVAVDADASPVRATELRGWLQSSLEKEGVRFTSAAENPDEGPVRVIVVEVSRGQWRLWSAEAPDAAVSIDASDHSVASLEALHQASLLLQESTTGAAAGVEAGKATDSPEFAQGAPVGDVNVPQENSKPNVERATSPKDSTLDVGFRRDEPFQRHAWVDVNLGSVVSERTNFVLGLSGALFRTPNWGGVVNLGLHHVSDFVGVDGSWELSLWNYRLGAGPMVSIPLSERLRFTTALELGVLVHTYQFTGEAWDARLNGQANVPLAFSVQGRNWRFGVTANLTLNTATFTHRVFGSPVWQTEQLTAALMASLGRRLW